MYVAAGRSFARFVSTDQHTVKPWFNGKLDFVPPVDNFADRGFALEGGRLDYLDGRTVRRLIYRHGKHPIIFCVARNRSVVTSAADCTQVSGYYVCSWVRDDMNFWAISDTSARKCSSSSRCGINRIREALISVFKARSSRA